MPKIKLKISIKNSNESLTNHTTGIYKDHVLKYLEDDNTKVTYHYQNHILKRENDEFVMTFDFDKKRLKTILKEYHSAMELDIKNIKIKEDNKNITIEYEIEKERFIYRIEEEI